MVSMKNTIELLRDIVSRHGIAQVSVWVGYKDTRAVAHWLERGRIPLHKQTMVAQMVKNYSRGELLSGRPLVF